MLEFDEADELFIGDKVLRYFGNCLDCGLFCKVFNYSKRLKSVLHTVMSWNGMQIKK